MIISIGFRVNSKKYGISTIHDSDIRYAREKGVKIKLVAQVVKVSDRKFTMFVMPEFVTPGKYIYSVDDEYNGVVIRGECYDRQFMFGKGAGSLPTASSILSDIMARQHDYRYEYKKQHYLDRLSGFWFVPLQERMNLKSWPGITAQRRQSWQAGRIFLQQL